jgi:hypothetical protein
LYRTVPLPDIASQITNHILSIFFESKSESPANNNELIHKRVVHQVSRIVNEAKRRGNLAMFVGRVSFASFARRNSARVIICLRRPSSAKLAQCKTVWNPLPPSLIAPTAGKSFHSSASVCLPVRRRRHGVGNAEVDNTEQRPKDLDAMGIRQPAVKDPEIFARESEKLMNKIFDALEPLKSVNDDYILTRGYEEEFGDFILLDLGPVRGQYNIQVDLEQKVIMIQSPISGQLLYILSATTGDWCGDVDGHRMEGLLVRDLIRQINGVPNF